MARRLILAALAVTMCAPMAGAKDFGRYGPLWEIGEPSILETIHARLGEMEQSGELSQMESDMKETTRAYVNRPRPVVGLLPVEEYRRFDVDLSIVLSRDLADHKGKVFAKKGTRINPLKYSVFNQRIVIIDGDDEDQVDFAVSLGNELDTILVLSNGAPLQLMRKHQRRFYFDQDAQLVRKFQIERVPSVISRGEESMIVEEIPMAEWNNG